LKTQASSTLLFFLRARAIRRPAGLLLNSLHQWIITKYMTGEWTNGKWKGIMISGFLEIPVSLTYNSPSIELREWFGSGLTDKYWPMNQLQFETNIGTVLIVNQAIRSGSRHYIDFKGSGKAKGPLAEAME
jgi:hypothetical protein